MTDPASVRNLVETVLDEHGGIDVLVNNAGIVHNIPSEEVPDEEWLAVISVNLNGVFWCCREVGKVMLERGSGSIVNIASMSGIISNHPQPQSAYNASKAAVITLTKSLAGEWAGRGVRVNSVSPGYIRTPLTELGMSRIGVVGGLALFDAVGTPRRTRGDLPRRPLPGLGRGELRDRHKPRHRRWLHLVVRA